ncbi:MAG: universal stress protein, partial [Cyanobacteria bacterium J06636_16]
IALARHQDFAVTLLHISSKPLSQNEEDWLKTRMLELAGKSFTDLKIITQVIYRTDVARAILQESKSHDLMIMRTRRRRTSAGGLAIGDVSNHIVNELDCSLILLGEPSTKKVAAHAPIKKQKYLVQSPVS